MFRALPPMNVSSASTSEPRPAHLHEGLGLYRKANAVHHEPRRLLGDAEAACDFAAADAILQLTSGHTAGSHFPNGIGESSNTVPTFSENFWSGCGS
jgi:hypothetical protein